ncbi:MAG: hypothetical protein HY298_12725 [Verrucomicrobia bacterium]|nr:hypothetical protein [Verrucomicrobiota bacterium]
MKHGARSLPLPAVAAAVVAAVVAADVRRRIPVPCSHRGNEVDSSSLPSASLLRRLHRWIPLLLLFLSLTAPAQPFTNSATLAAARDGTNLVVTYSLANTQGWVTLFQADKPEMLLSNAQPVDLAPAPASGSGQFTVPLDPTAPTRFYRLLIEQYPTRGKALVFVNGPLDFDAMRLTYGAITNNDQSTNSVHTNSTPMIFRQPVQVWLNHLGYYDTNGVLVGDNGGMLNGKYSRPDVSSIDDPGHGFLPISPLQSVSNDFRVDYAGDANVPAREAVIWSTEAQMYYDVDNYRSTQLTDAFIQELQLPAQIEQNLINLQYRPDLNMGSPPTMAKPILRALEDSGTSSYLRLYPIGNAYSVSLRTRAASYVSFPPLSLGYDSEAFVGDYVGLVFFWVFGTNSGYGGDAFYGQNSEWISNVVSPVNNALSAWIGYRYFGNSEIYRYIDYSKRIWGGRPCGGTGIPCDQGQNIRNVMMFDEANTSHDGVFPYLWPANVATDPVSVAFSIDDGPAVSDLAALYIAAIFYDLAHEAGLGLHKTDLLIWKTISLITDNVNFPMRALGGKVQEAARALWPDPRPGRAGLSLYEEDVVDVLTSRGIPMNGVADFRTNLPVAIGVFPGSLDVSSANRFGSGHPETQPAVNSYGAFSGFMNGYTQTNAAPTNYVAYQFYKHSKYGPCDELRLTDGTLDATTGVYNNDGSYYLVLTNRDLGNLTVLAPGNHIKWARMRFRCPNEATGFYAEDVRPFGFRLIAATPNGFSFTATALSETATNKTYQLTILDPSVATIGTATYAWTFTDYLGNTNNVAGSVVSHTALKDQPFTLSIARTRAAQTDTLTLRERGNDLDRNGGNAFVRNLVP